MRSTDSVTVAPKVDCITTSVEIAAQYASGIPISRATQTETVGAAAVLIECIPDGRFPFFQFQSFMHRIISGSVRCGQAHVLWRMSSAQNLAAALSSDWANRTRAAAQWAALVTLVWQITRSITVPIASATRAVRSNEFAAEVGVVAQKRESYSLLQ